MFNLVNFLKGIIIKIDNNFIIFLHRKGQAFAKSEKLILSEKGSVSF